MKTHAPCGKTFKTNGALNNHINWCKATNGNSGGEIDLAKLTDAMGKMALAVHDLSPAERKYAFELGAVLLR